MRRTAGNSSRSSSDWWCWTSSRQAPARASNDPSVVEAARSSDMARFTATCSAIASSSTSSLRARFVAG